MTELQVPRHVTLKVGKLIYGYEISETATQAIYLKHGDVNGDGDIDIADAVRIVNHVVGKILALARPTKEVKDEKVPQ